MFRFLCLFVLSASFYPVPLTGKTVQANPCDFGSPLTDPANCGRGGTSCPDNYTCEIDPADRFAVCCPKEKLGQCPAQGIGICVDSCSHDGDCKGKKKCCSTGCGHTCQNPEKKQKGKCPAPGIGICVESCSHDGDCNGIQICCSNGCGHTCQNPES